MSDERVAVSVMSVLLVFAISGAGQVVERLDLERLMRDPAALAEMVVMYRPDDSIVLFVKGNGRVVRQTTQDARSDALVPTCSGSVGQDDVKHLLQTFIEHHFFDLPIRSYLIVEVAMDDSWKALKLHSITIDDGTSRASRSFAAGIYQGQQETIPADFTAIENELRRIEKIGIQTEPCHLSPAIRLPERAASTPKAGESSNN